MVNTETLATTTVLKAVREPLAPEHRAVKTLDVFCCPCCSAPSSEFLVSIADIGICFSMTCPRCRQVVEALIRTAVQPVLGLA